MYPSYYRKGAVCIKRESSISGKQVNLEESYNTEAFQVIKASDKKSFDALIAEMDMVSYETYERYLILLNKRMQYEQGRAFRDVHHRSPEFFTSTERRTYED